MKWLQVYGMVVNVAEQVHAVNSEEKEKAATLRVALEDQMDQLRDVHQKQVGELRDEISEKQALINQLKELVTTSTTQPDLVKQTLLYCLHCSYKDGFKRPSSHVSI